MAGNLVSTLVLARLLHGVGWTAGLRGQRAGRRRRAGACCCCSCRTTPRGASRSRSRTRARAYVRRQIAASWREPGTRLGLWVHFTTQFPAMVFLLLWGMPFLVEAQGLSRATAGELLTLVVLSNMVVGLRLRPGHRPAPRGAAAAGARHRGGDGAVWAAVLACPADRAPHVAAGACCARCSARAARRR